MAKETALKSSEKEGDNMSDNKVTLPREVGRALDDAVVRFGSDGVLKLHADVPNGWNAYLTALNNLDLMTLASALVNGYTVEVAPKVEFANTLNSHVYMAEFYSGFHRRLENGEKAQERYSSGYVDGATELAKAYGIRIEGVNA